MQANDVVMGWPAPGPADGETEGRPACPPEPTDSSSSALESALDATQAQPRGDVPTLDFGTQLRTPPCIGSFHRHGVFEPGVAIEPTAATLEGYFRRSKQSSRRHALARARSHRRSIERGRDGSDCLASVDTNEHRVDTDVSVMASAASRPTSSADGPTDDRVSFLSARAFVPDSSERTNSPMSARHGEGKPEGLHVLV